jgi:hypothetical protein
MFLVAARQAPDALCPSAHCSDEPYDMCASLCFIAENHVSGELVVRRRYGSKKCVLSFKTIDTWIAKAQDPTSEIPPLCETQLLHANAKKGRTKVE